MVGLVMWLVRIALQRPYTFIVMAMLIVIVGVTSIVRMPTDIFPDIDIPVITVVWNYSGLPPEEMERRIVNNYERFLTTVVNDIERIESQALTGVAVIKIYFQPGASIDAAVAQVTAASQTAVRQMPPGATPPLVIRYSASNVPILQLGLSSDSMSEQQLFDVGVNFIRADIATVRGTQIPWPYGGKQRQIVVDLDPKRLYAWGLSPRDVTGALGVQNVILPTGTAKMGASEYPIVLNSSPELLQEIGNLPIKTAGGTTVFIRDIATVRDGFQPQTNMVHIGGQRSVLLSVLKNGGASTLDVVNGVRDMLPSTLARVPKELNVASLFDQSLFVRAAGAAPSSWCCRSRCRSWSRSACCTRSATR
jgi:multidrug efflux pump subunit AcrB